VRLAVDGHRHALHRAIDIDDDGSVGGLGQRGREYQHGENAVQITHGSPDELST